jgi:hypothetical protein
MVNMRNTLFSIAMLWFSCIGYSQDFVDEEFEIYGTLIGQQGYQFFPIDFGIPNDLKFEINDSIYSEINQKIVKDFDYKKLLSVALKHSVNKTFKIIESDLYNHIYLSPIYFKNKDEAYFLYVIKTNLKKPYMYFKQSKKIAEKWVLSDYYVIY